MPQCKAYAPAGSSRRCLSKTTDVSGICTLHRQQPSPSSTSALQVAIEINGKVLLHIASTNPADPLQEMIAYLQAHQREQQGTPPEPPDADGVRPAPPCVCSCCNMQSEFDSLHSEIASLRELVKQQQAKAEDDQSHSVLGAQVNELKDWHIFKELMAMKRGHEDMQNIRHFFEEQARPTLTLVPVNLDAFADGTFRFESIGNEGDQRLGSLNVEVAKFIDGSAIYAALVGASMKQAADSPSADAYFKFNVSPVSRLTLSESAKKLAGIPEQASFYLYCYPLADSFAARGFMLGAAAAVDGGGDGPDGAFEEDAAVCWLLYGAFMYLDQTKQRILKVNAFSTTSAENALQLGHAVPMPPACVKDLEDTGRWKPVTIWDNNRIGMEHAWVSPGENLPRMQGHQFPRSGGFGYRYLYCDRSHAEEGSDRYENTFFVPVVSKDMWQKDSTVYDIVKVVTGVHFPELQEAASLRGSQSNVGSSSKFAGVLKTGTMSSAVEGIHLLLGITEQQLAEIKHKGIGAIKEEFEKAKTEEGKSMWVPASKWVSTAEAALGEVEYILNQPAAETEVTGNDGFATTQDKGHAGKMLAGFVSDALELLPPGTNDTNLDAEVLALRLYTGKMYQHLNGPLRARADTDSGTWHELPHPFAAVVYFIAEGISKVGVCRSAARCCLLLLPRCLSPRCLEPLCCSVQCCTPAARLSFRPSINAKI
jgi:hypothetical protein